MKAIFGVFCLFIAISACQPIKKDVTVPSPIKEAFQKLHPNASEIHWIQEPSIYEAKFIDGSLKGAVSFNEKGEVVETEEVIPQEQLPNISGILEYIKTTYPGETVKQCEKITKQDNSIIYELQINGKELVFDSQGKFLEEEPD